MLFRTLPLLILITPASALADGLPAPGLSGSGATSTTVTVMSQPVVTVSGEGTVSAGTTPASPPESSSVSAGESASQDSAGQAPSAPTALSASGTAGALDCSVRPAGKTASIADLVAAQSAAIVPICAMDMALGRDAYAAITANAQLTDALAQAGSGLGQLRAATVSAGRISLYVVLAR